MILGLYISNNCIRAAHLDQDGLPVHLTISNTAEKYILDPTIFLNEEFAHTGEHIDKLRYTRPDLKIYKDIITNLEKEFHKVEEISWQGKSLFTLICKYIMFKSSSSVSTHFDRVIVSCPAEHGHDDYLTVSEAIRMNGARFVKGISHEEAIYYDLLSRKKIEPGYTSLALYIDENKATFSFLQKKGNKFSKAKPYTFDLLGGYRTEIVKQLMNDFHKKHEWTPSHIDQYRLEKLVKEAVRCCLLNEEKIFKKNMILGNQAISIQLDEQWISNKSNQLISQLSTEITQYLELNKLSKEKIQAIFIHGSFASMPLLGKVCLEINDQLKDKIFIDPDGTTALNGLLNYSSQFSRDQDTDVTLIEMPSFIKNVTVNNLIV